MILCCDMKHNIFIFNNIEAESASEKEMIENSQ